MLCCGWKRESAPHGIQQLELEQRTRTEYTQYTGSDDLVGTGETKWLTTLQIRIQPYSSLQDTLSEIIVSICNCGISPKPWPVCTIMATKINNGLLNHLDPVFW